MNKKDIRWKQRFSNLEKAFHQLEQGLTIKDPSEIEEQGIIQSFEFSFELAWKTLKDYLESKGTLVSFPRDVIKEAFHHEIIDNGEVWLEMLEKRNFLAHTYDEKKTREALKLIRDTFFPEIKQVISFFAKEASK